MLTQQEKYQFLQGALAVIKTYFFAINLWCIFIIYNVFTKHQHTDFLLENVLLVTIFVYGVYLLPVTVTMIKVQQAFTTVKTVNL